jgi:hypothetical protein
MAWSNWSSLADLVCTLGFIVSTSRAFLREASQVADERATPDGAPV